MALGRCCVVGPCGLTCSNATSRSFVQTECSVLGVELTSAWRVSFQKISKKDIRKKTSRKFDNKVPKIIGNPYFSWGCFFVLKPYRLGLMSFYPLPQTNPRKWWFVSKFGISSNGACFFRWTCFDWTRPVVSTIFPKNPRCSSRKICRIDSVETSHPFRS